MFAFRVRNKWIGVSCESSPGIETFCAMYVLGDFYTCPLEEYLDDTRYAWGKSLTPSVDDFFDTYEKVNTRNFWTKFVDKTLQRDGSVFMGDTVDGIGSKFFFDKFPKTPRMYKGRLYKFHVSAPYRNANSGNMVRHCIVTCTTAEKGKK